MHLRELSIEVRGDGGGCEGGNLLVVLCGVVVGASIRTGIFMTRGGLCWSSNVLIIFEDEPTNPGDPLHMETLKKVGSVACSKLGAMSAIVCFPTIIFLDLCTKQ